MSTSQEKKLPSNRTYTVDDIAAILGVAKSTAYRLVNSGEFKQFALVMRSVFLGSHLRTGWLWGRVKNFSHFSMQTLL